MPPIRLEPMRIRRDSAFSAGKRCLAVAILAALPTFLTVPGPSSAPEADLSHFAGAALSETAQLLERYGEIERASELAFHTISENAADQPDRDRLRTMRIRLLVKKGEYRRADSLLSMEPLPERNEDYFAHMLMRARLHHLSGENERALDLISSLDSLSFDLLNVHRSMLKMQIHAGRGDYASAAAVGNRVWRTGIPPSLSPEFEKTLLPALESTHQLHAALRVIGKLKDRYGIRDTMFDLLGREMKIRLALGDTVRARQLAFDVAGAHGTKKIALEFARTALAIFSLESLSDKEAMQFCEVLLDHGETAEARALLAALSERPSPQPFAENLRYMHARTLFQDRNYGAAAAVLQETYSDPQVPKQALLLMARAYRMMGNYEKSADAYSKYGLTYADSRLASETLYIASHLYDAIDRHAEAESLRMRLVSRYPNQYHGKRSLIDLARTSLRQRNFGEGVAMLKRAMQRSTAPEEDVLYYLAFAYEQMGEDSLEAETTERLRTTDPRSFYLLPRPETAYSLPVLSSGGAAELVGTGGLIAFLQTLEAKRREAYALVEAAVERKTGDSRSWEQSTHYRRAALFLNAGFLDWGTRELNAAFDALKKNPAGLLALGRLCEEHALAWHSTRAFDTLRLMLGGRRGLLPDETFDVFLYPVPFPGAIFEQCIRRNLPPHLAYAMIREESRFDPNAVSAAGAMGLMQIMPRTGEAIGAEMGIALQSSALLLEPEINIVFGMSYAASLLEECGGNQHMMLSAYNAGMGNAKRWFGRATDELSVQEQVDMIDFRETRAYVRRIVESSHAYAAYFRR